MWDVLLFHGYEVEGADRGDHGLEKALSGQFHLVILDIMLPVMDGLTICQKIREQDSTVAIIMLTAKSTDEDAIAGFSLGADDYVTKPFSISQLLLRIQAILRRSFQSVRHLIDFPNGRQLDSHNLAVLHNEQSILLTRKEVELLLYLAQHSERAISREELLNKVWGYDRDCDIETRTVDIHIAKLRRKLEDNHKVPEVLLTIRGAGYRLMVGKDG